MRTPEWVWTGIAEKAWPYASRGVYGYMLARRNSKSGRCTASIDTMADDLGCGVSALKDNYLPELQRLGLITKEVKYQGRVRRNEYIVHVFDEAPERLRREVESGSRQHRRKLESGSRERLRRKLDNGSRQPRRKLDNGGRNPASTTGRNPAGNSPYGSYNSRTEGATDDVTVDPTPAWGPASIDYDAGEEPHELQTDTLANGSVSSLHSKKEGDEGDESMDLVMPYDDDYDPGGEFESLPPEALADVLLWHMIEDTRVQEAITDALDPHGCRGCGCRLADREWGIGVCDRCFEETVAP